MKVRYVYSACTVVVTPDVRICTDPWFTSGAYDGSWFQYPPLPGDPVDVIGDVDVIYVSHIHPDHYDPQFLRRYLQRHPHTELLIGETDPPHLLRKMTVDGFRPRIASTLAFGETSVSILANGGYSVDNVDTALVLTRRCSSVVNLNDNPLDQRQLERIRELCPGSRPDVALLPYAGAGSYPQTFDLGGEEAVLAAARRKEQQFLDVFSAYVRALSPRVAIPFAGKYWLGGPLASLNRLRGVPDATAVLSLHPGVAVVPADGGAATADAETLHVSETRERPYDAGTVDAYLRELDFPGYDYEREIHPLPDRSFPFAPLVQAAYRNALRKRRLATEHWYCIQPIGDTRYYCFNLGREGAVTHEHDVGARVPRTEIFIDPRYFFGLLTRLYHWNNAAIGSQYRTRRVPDEFDREAFGFLNYFHV